MEKTVLLNVDDLVAEEREQCCKDVCKSCRSDPPSRVQRADGSWVWRHHWNRQQILMSICDSSVIRERAHQEQEQDRFDREIGAASVVPSLHQQEQEGK